METVEASELLSSTRERLSVRLTLPPISFLKFPPADLPITLPPPPDHPALSHPFTIRADWYNGLLSANVPITIALVYASVVTFLNSVNVRRKYKPWPFSQTTLFKLMVVLHNIFLSLYSLWTFVGMCNALQLSYVSPRNENGWAATADSLCKIHGPRGLGSSATFNETSTAWTITNRAFHLGADGLTPDSTDVGRIWNEGLAFYGWLFYISKFYEVIDTLIILAKGKKSSLLQTYHHAGAMLGMWAGIRYMSPPIWMFVLVNSFIHFIMYTFYLCSAIGIKVPVWFKRTLTTMQITQFVVGASYAFAHLFVKYQSPLTVPYLYNLGNVVSSMPADVSSVASSAVAAASAETASWLKKLALRAAGREGLAENVFNERGEPFGIDAIHAVQILAKREEMRFREEVQWVNCLDTSGQTFAILLNCIYLAPLTWLFAQFFIKSYLQAVERRRRSSVGQRAYIAGQSSKDAFRSVGRRLSEAFEDSQAGVEDLDSDLVIVDGDEVRKEMAAALEKAKAGAETAVEKVVDQGIAPGSEAHEEPRNLTEDTSQDNKDEINEDRDSQQERDLAAEALDELAQRVKPESTGEEVATEKAEEGKDNGTQDLQQEAHEVVETAEVGNVESEQTPVDVEADKFEATEIKEEGTGEPDDARGSQEAPGEDLEEVKEEEANEPEGAQAPDDTREDDTTEVKEDDGKEAEGADKTPGIEAEEENTEKPEESQPAEEADTSASAEAKEEDGKGPEDAQPADQETDVAADAGVNEVTDTTTDAEIQEDGAKETLDAQPSEEADATTNTEVKEEDANEPKDAQPDEETDAITDAEGKEEDAKEREDTQSAEKADATTDAEVKEDHTKKSEDVQPTEEADTTTNVEAKEEDVKETEDSQPAEENDGAGGAEAKEEDVKESEDAEPAEDGDATNGADAKEEDDITNDAEAKEEDTKESEDSQAAEEASKDNDEEEATHEEVSEGAEAKEQEKVEDENTDGDAAQQDQPISDADAVKEPDLEPESEKPESNEKEDVLKLDDPQDSAEQRPEEKAVEETFKENEEDTSEPQQQKDGLEEANDQEVATGATADSDAEKPTVNGDQHQESSNETSAPEAQKKDAEENNEVSDGGQKEDAKSASKDEDLQDKADGA